MKKKQKIEETIITVVAAVIVDFPLAVISTVIFFSLVGIYQKMFDISADEAIMFFVFLLLGADRLSEKIREIWRD